MGRVCFSPKVLDESAWHCASDFVTGKDQTVLYKNTFTSISSVSETGSSTSQEFAIVTDDADAAISSADIVYHSVNGNLFYNPNGSDPDLLAYTVLLPSGIGSRQINNYGK